MALTTSNIDDISRFLNVNQQNITLLYRLETSASMFVNENNLKTIGINFPLGSNIKILCAYIQPSSSNPNINGTFDITTTFIANVTQQFYFYNTTNPLVNVKFNLQDYDLLDGYAGIYKRLLLIITSS